MSSYSDCPINDTGIHNISYNRYIGEAKCVMCGFVLIQTRVSKHDMQINLNNGNRLAHHRMYGVDKKN